jgi:hypothetical protein
LAIIVANIQKYPITILKLDRLDTAFDVGKVGEFEGNLPFRWGEEDAIFGDVKMRYQSIGGEVRQEAIAI